MFVSLKALKLQRKLKVAKKDMQEKTSVVHICKNCLVVKELNVKIHLS